MASWPTQGPPARHLVAAAERVLKEGRALALQLDPKAEAQTETQGEARGEAIRRPGSRTVAAQPVEAEDELVAVVVVDVAPRPSAELERVLRQLAWGAAWLELRFLGGEQG